MTTRGNKISKALRGAVLAIAIICAGHEAAQAPRVIIEQPAATARKAN